MVYLLGFKIDKEESGVYLNITDAVCYASKGGCYASRLITRIPYHILMFTNNDKILILLKA